MLEHIKYVNFTTPNGAKIFVNDDGDSVGEYDLINWHMRDDGSVELVNIGRYDTSFSEYRKLKLKGDAKIVWGGNSTKVE